jgi:phage protein D
MADYDFGANFINISAGWFDQTFHNSDSKEKGAEAHKAANAVGEGSQYTETAEAMIRGYPGLKAKTCVTFSGVGAGSGKWYCKKVEQSWSIQEGYVTKLYMTKGKGGGGGGESPPTPRQ